MEGNAMDADANGFGQQTGGSDGALPEQSKGGDEFEYVCEEFSDAKCERFQGVVESGAEAGATDGPGHGGDSAWWTTEPAVGRVAHGVASRVDRLRAIGNGQVPQVAAMAFQILSERIRER
jgi:DNA (cytosine-5)-methyltransferase 1